MNAVDTNAMERVLGSVPNSSSCGMDRIKMSIEKLTMDEDLSILRFHLVMATSV